MNNVVYLFAALIVAWPLLRHRVWWQQHRAALAAEWDRLTAPLPPERRKLSPALPKRAVPRRMVQIATAQTAPEPEPIPAGVEVVHIGRRETPAPAYQPAEGAALAADLSVTARGQDQDREPCADPCTGRHCAYHNAPGTDAQRWLEERMAALTTPTEEWDVTSLLGLSVPASPAELYAGSDIT